MSASPSRRPAAPATAWAPPAGHLLLASGPLLALIAALTCPALSHGAGHGARVLGVALLALGPLLLWIRHTAALDAVATPSVPPGGSVGTGAEADAFSAGEGDRRMRFVASLGHDLRSPLNAMLGFADLLQITAGPDDQGQHDSIEVIRQQTADLLVLIDDMLLWARLESGELQLRPAEVAVRALLDRSAALAVQRSGNRGLRVHCQVPATLPALRVDPERVVQAIVALLHDAVHTHRHAEVQLGARATREGVCVDVHDPGLLIRQTDQEAFFEPFRPSFAPSGQRVAGLGVGVACARAFIHAHGGSLSLTTDATHGTTFSLHLPRSPR